MFGLFNRLHLLWLFRSPGIITPVIVPPTPVLDGFITMDGDVFTTADGITFGTLA